MVSYSGQLYRIIMWLKKERKYFPSKKSFNVETINFTKKVSRLLYWVPVILWEKSWSYKARFRCHFCSGMGHVGGQWLWSGAKTSQAASEVWCTTGMFMLVLHAGSLSCNLGEQPENARPSCIFGRKDRGFEGGSLLGHRVTTGWGAGPSVLSLMTCWCPGIRGCLGLGFSPLPQVDVGKWETVPDVW